MKGREDTENLATAIFLHLENLATAIYSLPLSGGTKQSSDSVSKLNWERKDRGGGRRKEGGEGVLKPVGWTLGRM